MITLKRLISLGLTLALTVTLTGCLSFLGIGGDNAPKKTPKKSGSSTRVTTTEEARAQINMAAALLMEGDYGRALPELIKAREMDPKNADVENYLGLAYYGLKDYGQAVTSFENALKINPKRSDVHNNLGLVYLNQQNYDKALEEFNTCLKDLTYQKKQLPLSNIGLAYLEMGRYDESLAALTRAVEVAPNYPKSYQLIGRVHMAKGQYGEATKYLRKAQELDPNDSMTQQLMNEATNKGGR